MMRLKNIQPMTEFKTNTAAMLGKMREERLPLILTVNGKAECVLQDPQSYEEILERLEKLEAENERLKHEALRAAVAIGIEQADKGEFVHQSMREIFAEVREERQSSLR